MSKSRGNIVRPDPIRQVMGVDALRYFLLREVMFGQDGSFSYDALVGRYNSDLANGLGNLASRTLSMIQQYRGGVIPQGTDAEICSLAGQTVTAAEAAFDRFEFSRGLEAVWSLISAVDKFIVQKAPWKLAKQPDAQAELDATLHTSAEALRIVTALLYPILPQSTPKVWAQLGMKDLIESVRLSNLKWGQLSAGQKIGEVVAVFPRLEPKPAIDKMRELEVVATAEQNKLLGKTAELAAEATPETPKIAIDDFGKVDLRVGQVLSAETVKGA